jgi:hypothetical protein
MATSVLDLAFRIWQPEVVRPAAYDEKIRSMISAPVVMTGRSSRR